MNHATQKYLAADLAPPVKTDRVLSVLQPWASLLVLGRLSIYVRARPVGFRGLLWIHASASLTEGHSLWVQRNASLQRAMRAVGLRSMNDVPMGAIIGTMRIDGEQQLLPGFMLQPPMASMASEELDLNDFSVGKSVVFFSGPRSMDKPVTFAGQAGLWHLPPEILTACREQLEKADA